MAPHPASSGHDHGDSTTDSRVDRAETVVAASPDQVYAALLDAGALQAWLAPEGATAQIEDLDARVGGGYRATLCFADPVDPKTTDDSDATRVVFVRLDPGRLVEQTVTFETTEARFAGAMRMAWQLEAAGTGTRVTVTATDVPLGISRHDHEVGLASSLANLAAYLAP